MRLFCWHKWKILKQVKLKDMDYGFTGVRFYLQCEKCGMVKKKDCI